MKSQELSGEILVTENQNYYFVKIHPNDRDLAKSIEGYRWNSKIKLWVYQKNIKTYLALEKKFKTIAKLFDLKNPIKEKEFNLKSTWKAILPKLVKESDINSNPWSEEDSATEIEENLENLDIIDPFYEQKVEQNKKEFEAKRDAGLLKDIGIEPKKYESKDNVDQFLNNLLSKFPDDEFSQLLRTFNFSTENPERAIIEIQKKVLLELRKLIDDDEYEKYRVTCWEYKKKSERDFTVSKENYKCSLFEVNRKAKKYIVKDTRFVDASKLIDTANHLRNRMFKEYVPENLYLLHAINYILIMRTAWERISLSH